MPKGAMWAYERMMRLAEGESIAIVTGGNVKTFKLVSVESALANSESGTVKVIGMIESVKKYLASLPSDDERKQFLDYLDICLHCGSLSRPCYCQYDD